MRRYYVDWDDDLGEIVEDDSPKGCHVSVYDLINALEALLKDLANRASED